MTSHPSRRSLGIVATTILLPFLLVSCSGSSGGQSQSGATLNGTGSTAEKESMLSMRADRSDARPGEEVSYTIAVFNRTPIDFTDAEVSVTFPIARIRVTFAPGGTINDDRITWQISRLRAGQTTRLSYRGTLATALQGGDVVRTVASLRAGNLANPFTTQAEVRIAGTGQASSVSPGYSFFLGESGASLRSDSGQASVSRERGSTASVASVSDSAAVNSVPPPATSSILSITQEPNTPENTAGGTVRYTVTVRNVSSTPLANLTLQALLPPALTVLYRGGGTLTPDSLTWTIRSLDIGQSRSFTYGGKLSRTVQPGDVVTTIAQVSDSVLSTPQVATTGVRIVAASPSTPMPRTGAEDRFFRPVEDTGKYLTPIR